MARVRIAGHQVHPALVVFPLGLLATSLVWDLAYLATGRAMWAQISFWTIIAGLIGGAVAGVPGFIDWMGIPDRTRAKRIGIYHLAANAIVLLLFVISAVARYTHGYEVPTVGMMVVGWIGIAVAIVSGWLGGELVERLGVGVSPDANLNAPSSLESRAGGRRFRPSEPTPTTP